MAGCGLVVGLVVGLLSGWSSCGEAHRQGSERLRASVPMTNVLPRPVPPPPPPPPPRLRPPLRPPSQLRAGLPAAAWALAAGLLTIAVPVLLAWAADPRSDSGAPAALRTVGQLLLLAHGAALEVPGGRIDLVPLGLLAVPLLLLARAGRQAAAGLAAPGTESPTSPGSPTSSGVRSSTVPARAAGVAGLRLAVSVALPYALVVLVVAAASAGADVHIPAGRAVLGAVAVGLLGSAVGVLHGAGLGALAWATVPPRLRRVLLAAAAALASLLGAAALLVGISLAVHLVSAAAIAEAMGPGVVGGLVLLVLGLVLVPNAVVWGACWLAGPGFAVGVDTAVGPFGTTLGPVPAVPMAAALPAGPVPVWVGLLALLAPLLAGAVAGLLLHRRAGSVPDALLSGPVAGLLLGVLAGLSSGALGGARLSQIGPSPWRVGAAVALEVAVGAVVALLLSRRLSRRRFRRLSRLRSRLRWARLDRGLTDVASVAPG